MQIVKGIVIGIYFIVCLALVILAMVQSKEDAGLSSTITGTSANNFFFIQNSKYGTVVQYLQ